MPSMQGTCTSPMNLGKVFEKTQSRVKVNVEIEAEHASLEVLPSIGYASINIESEVNLNLGGLAKFILEDDSGRNEITVDKEMAEAFGQATNGYLDQFAPGYMRLHCATGETEVREITVSHKGETLVHVYLKALPVFVKGDVIVCDKVQYAVLEDFSWEENIDSVITTPAFLSKLFREGKILVLAKPIEVNAKGLAYKEGR